MLNVSQYRKIICFSSSLKFEPIYKYNMKLYHIHLFTTRGSVLQTQAKAHKCLSGGRKQETLRAPGFNNWYHQPLRQLELVQLDSSLFLSSYATIDSMHWLRGLRSVVVPSVNLSFTIRVREIILIRLLSNMLQQNKILKNIVVRGCGGGGEYMERSKILM